MYIYFQCHLEMNRTFIFIPKICSCRKIFNRYKISNKSNRLSNKKVDIYCYFKRKVSLVFIQIKIMKDLATSSETL